MANLVKYQVLPLWSQALDVPFSVALHLGGPDTSFVQF